MVSNVKWGETLEYVSHCCGLFYYFSLKIAQVWDGSTLSPTKQSQIKLGMGKWNGVWLAWYSESHEPFLKYYYSPGDRKCIILSSVIAFCHQFD